MNRGRRVTVTFATDEKTLAIVLEALTQRRDSFENSASRDADGATDEEDRQRWRDNARALREVIGQIS